MSREMKNAMQYVYKNIKSCEEGELEYIDEFDMLKTLYNKGYLNDQDEEFNVKTLFDRIKKYYLKKEIISMFDHVENGELKIYDFELEEYESLVGELFPQLY